MTARSHAYLYIFLKSLYGLLSGKQNRLIEILELKN